MSWVERKLRDEGLVRAAELLWREGYTGATARELAAAAGGSVDSLYRHFGSKLGLARAVVDLADVELGAEARLALHRHPAFDEADRPLAAGGTVRRELETVWWEVTAFALQLPAVFGFAYLQHRHPDGDAGRVDAGRHRGVLELLEELLARGHAGGEVRPDVPLALASTLLWATLCQCIQRWQASGVPPGDREVLGAFDAVWRACASSPGPR